MRFLEWTLNKPHITVMVGGIGADEPGNVLKKLVERDGVKAR